MDGLLFDPTEFTDQHVLSVMQGHTCRQCANRTSVRQASCKIQLCQVRKSRRTKSGFLRVRVDQPACYLFTTKK